VEKLRVSKPATALHSGFSALLSLDALRTLRSAGSALLSQAALHGQLAEIEWAEEKNRLFRMLLVMLAGFACLLCTLLFTGVLVVALSWETPYRITAIIALMVIHGAGFALAWHHFQTLSRLGSEAFAATREELAADMDLIRGRHDT